MPSGSGVCCRCLSYLCNKPEVGRPVGRVITIVLLCLFLTRITVAGVACVYRCIQAL